MEAISLTKDVRAATILKLALTVFFVICLWLNYPLDADAHFVVSHLATAALLALAPFLALSRSKITVRKPWGTKSDYLILAPLLLFLFLRMCQSIGNQFFFGQASKIILILIGWLCFKSLDPDGKLFRFFAVSLPVIFAAGVVVGIIIWAITGKIGEERLRISPNDYEYVSEYAGLMMPLILFSLDELKEIKYKIMMFFVFVIVSSGLVLTGARGPLIGAIIVVLTYSYLARKRVSMTVWVSAIVTFAIIVIALGSFAYTTGSQTDTSRFSLGDHASLDDPASLEAFTSGRLSNWAYLTTEMLSNNTWIVFGSGLGQLAEWIPSDGGFYRPAITNGLLSSWVPFGLLGLFGYIYFNIYLWRRIRHVEPSPYRCMAISLFLAYIVTDQIETHWQGTNMLWYVSFILYILTLARPTLLPQAVTKAAPSPSRSVLTLSKSDA
jgi:O-Antigen ligase